MYYLIIESSQQPKKPVGFCILPSKSKTERVSLRQVMRLLWDLSFGQRTVPWCQNAPACTRQLWSRMNTSEELYCSHR